MGSVAQSERSIDRTVFMRLSLAAASIAAGLIRASVVPHHLEESIVLGVAFVATAIFQIAWAAPVSVRLDRRLLDIGAVVNGAVVAAWIASRTVGLPFGPHAWLEEPIGAVDATATLLELLIVIGSALVPTSQPAAIPSLRMTVGTRDWKRNAVTDRTVEDRVERSQRARIAVQRFSRCSASVRGKAIELDPPAGGNRS